MSEAIELGYFLGARSGAALRAWSRLVLFADAIVNVCAAELCLSLPFWGFSLAIESAAFVPSPKILFGAAPGGPDRARAWDTRAETTESQRERESAVRGDEDGEISFTRYSWTR